MLISIGGHFINPNAVAHVRDALVDTRTEWARVTMIDGTVIDVQNMTAADVATAINNAAKPTIDNTIRVEAAVGKQQASMMYGNSADTFAFLRHEYGTAPETLKVAYRHDARYIIERLSGENLFRLLKLVYDLAQAETHDKREVVDLSMRARMGINAIRLDVASNKPPKT